jgi:hypothetical protein
MVVINETVEDEGTFSNWHKLRLELDFTKSVTRNAVA